MTFQPSSRGLTPPFHVMSVWAAATRRAEAGLPVFNLAAGQPSSPAPEPVRSALHRALDEELLGYTETPGILPLRQGIAKHYRDWYDLSVDPAEVVVTTGSSGAFLLAFLAAFDVGARVGMAIPCYPAYRNILQALGCEVVEIPTGVENRFQPTVAAIKDLNLAGLVVASPANPSGTMLSAAELASLAHYCDSNGIRLISDEIYHGITYAGRGSCSWATARSGFVINSFSKYFSMTGWRVGWALVPADVIDAVQGLAGNMTICPPAPAQFAAVAAFDSYAECDSHVARYARNRTVMLEGLAALGFSKLAPADGAFYVYADISHLTNDSLAWCAELLARTGVAVAPGVDFDPVGGRKTMRLSFAGQTEVIEQALGALQDYLGAGTAG
ncbi:aminotransferase class I/II-fold pyridoxal phosphate-dependent enzyme [Nakamurella antarctica]|uniref:Aminotransferase n=1 Tax=Nakamurella antarctica TaxID=1902245 RepID=A0A3G8ZP88_9ACTN|nr:aminotransferase class I/II-fold pyridoxal phosphate-dependent enzyme [Nakamurella antarctica]AZI59080.1 aminotransferase class I/II-fold pyridoxal phosphate-dependent enzyme [Nakamurella antarctica]